MMRFVIGAVVALLVVGPALAQEKPPAPEKPPVVSELSTLKIQNALLRANATQAKYERDMKDLGDIIKAEIGLFEKEHPGWTIDAQKMVVVKKPAAK